MKNALLFSMLILLFACQEKTAKQAEKQAIETPKLKETKDFTKKQTDFFVDSTQVAQKEKYCLLFPANFAIYNS